MSVKLDPDLLDHELARRGITQAELARVAGVHEMTLSRAATGKRVSEKTFTLISVGLARVPALPGADGLLAAPGVPE